MRLHNNNNNNDNNHNHNNNNNNHNHTIGVTVNNGFVRLLRWSLQHKKITPYNFRKEVTISLL